MSHKCLAREAAVVQQQPELRDSLPMPRSTIYAVVLLAISTAGCRKSDVPAVTPPVTHRPATAPARPVVRAARPPSPTLSVYKCVGADGGLAYQDEPCAEGSREASRHEERVAPKRSRAAIVAQAQREAAEVAAIAHHSAPRKTGGLNAANERVTARRRYCEQTRAEVQRERDRNWTRLTVDYLRSLDERVHRACQG